VSVDAAADFAEDVAFLLLNVLLAARAAAAELSFVVLLWARAEAAADFAAFEADAERRVLDAFVAAGLLVFSEFFLDMTLSLRPPTTRLMRFKEHYKNTLSLTRDASHCRFEHMKANLRSMLIGREA
jgi:hypothetical protein